MSDAQASPPRIVGRRHRPWLGVSGLVLAIAMFLPAVHACDADAAPYQILPVFWPPYVLGACFFAIALTERRRAFIAAAWLLRGMLIVYAVASAASVPLSSGIGIVGVPIALMLLSLNGFTSIPTSAASPRPRSSRAACRPCGSRRGASIATRCTACICRSPVRSAS